jgi:membrane associated rhomboid family serine protease
MLLLPVGHEEAEYRRLPVVALGFMGLCVLVFCVTLVLGRLSESEAEARAVEVLEFAERIPDLKIDEEFLFATTRLQLERRRLGLDYPQWGEVEEEPTTEQQRTLDALTARWRAAHESAPAERFGLKPAELGVVTLVSHIFVHAGLLHLIGNLFFFWLVGPPLEDVWGRPLFAAFVLACGVAAALLWAARYPESSEPVIGASGAIAGLMGGFFVRFWGSRVRMFYVLWFVFRIHTGFFHAPAWSMLALWLAREIAIASWLEPHVMPVGGVATWAHVFGFGTGAVVALGLKFLRVEERWATPAISRATGGVENPLIEASFELQREGRWEEAWSLLSEECRSGSSSEAVGRWWDLAIGMGRQGEVAPFLLRRIERQLRRGEIDLACRDWLELRAHVGDLQLAPNLAVGLAEALIEWGGPHEEYEALLLAARADLGESPPVGTLLRLARASAGVGLAGTAQFCLQYADAVGVDAEVGKELREIAAGAGS